MAISNAERQKAWRARRNALAQQAHREAPKGPLDALEQWRETVLALSAKEQEAAWRAMNKARRDWLATKPATRRDETGHPLDDLVIRIRGHVFDAGCANQTEAKYVLQAGWRLLELRKRVEAGEAGDVGWWEYFETKFAGHIKSRKYAEKLMRWAQANDPVV